MKTYICGSSSKFQSFFHRSTSCRWACWRHSLVAVDNKLKWSSKNIYMNTSSDREKMALKTLKMNSLIIYVINLNKSNWLNLNYPFVIIQNLFDTGNATFAVTRFYEFCCLPNTRSPTVKFLTAEWVVAFNKYRYRLCVIPFDNLQFGLLYNNVIRVNY